jgi:hypothetical protein
MSDMELSETVFEVVYDPAGLKRVLEEYPEANVDLYRDAGGSTSLMRASILNLSETVGVLLDHKADVNAQHDKGYTSLDKAIDNRSEETALLLLERGADVHIKGPGDRDALYWSLRRGSKIIAYALLCCGADARRVRINNKVSQAKVDAAISEYKDTQDFIATTQHILKKTLSTLVQVDTRVGLGQNGIYQEPLELTLEYLGLSLDHDQVVNTSIDDTLRQRVLLCGQPRSAVYWYCLLKKEQDRMFIEQELAGISAKYEKDTDAQISTHHKSMHLLEQKFDQDTAPLHKILDSLFK